MFKVKLSSILVLAAIILSFLFMVFIGNNAFAQGVVQSDVSPNGFERTYGQNRYDTNSKVVRKAVKTADKVVMLTGNDKSQIQKAQTLAFNERLPIVLTDSAKLPQESLQLLKDLKVKEIILLGNTKDITPNVENTLKGIANVQRINEKGKEVEVQELVKLLPKAEGKQNVAYIPMGSVHDYLSGLSLQSAGNYRVIPAQSLNPVDLNNYDNLVIVGPKNGLDIATKIKVDPKKTYEWQELIAIINYNDTLDYLYESNVPILKDGKYIMSFNHPGMKLKYGIEDLDDEYIDLVKYRYRLYFNSTIADKNATIYTPTRTTFNKKTKIYTSMCDAVYTKEDYARYKEETKILRKWVRDNINPSMNDVEKLRTINNWIVKNVTYDREYKEVYDLLIQKRGTCDPITKTFMDLALMVNIKVDIESGYFEGHDLSHAWCSANVNKKTYYFDPTFAINEYKTGGNPNQFFMMTLGELGAKGYNFN